ncbi:MAG: hypothetical protein M0R17_07005 [Candidatus Omnitrophica bacterium]|jgi:hypothetical protein|nr:hypothetical protein [Candidatus Omnitrophota bacterium]
MGFWQKHPELVKRFWTKRPEHLRNKYFRECPSCLSTTISEYDAEKGRFNKGSCMACNGEGYISIYDHFGSLYAERNYPKKRGL